MYPRLASRIMELDVNYTNTLVGIKESAEKMVQLLKKMGLNSRVKNAETLEVEVDAIRTDILHPCDLAEDVAIAYDINKCNNKIFDNYFFKHYLIF